jgi:8-amino-7-oxononanoate synthase
MDGDRAPLGELAALSQEFDAWLMADDAHDLDFGNAARAGVPLKIGTLSKAIGAYGGYLCASQPVIDLVRNRARTVIYTTGLPPSIIASAIAALDLIEREPERLDLPLQKARAFTRGAGLPQAQSSIVPVVIGEAQAALQASQLLEAEGFLAVAIRPPTVPEGTARLRFSFSAVHPDEAIARVAELVRTRILGNR